MLVCPNREPAVVKSLAIEEASQTVVFAGKYSHEINPITSKTVIFTGDQATVSLSGIEMQNVSVGNILCDPQRPVPVAARFEARIVVFNVQVPITKGFSVNNYNLTTTTTFNTFISGCPPSSVFG